MKVRWGRQAVHSGNDTVQEGDCSDDSTSGAANDLLSGGANFDAQDLNYVKDCVGHEYNWLCRKPGQGDASTHQSSSICSTCRRAHRSWQLLASDQEFMSPCAAGATVVLASFVRYCCAEISLIGLELGRVDGLGRATGR
jgi:hypothetical protein